MNASKKITLTIVSVFVAVLAILAGLLYQQARLDIRQESDAALEHARFLVGQSLPDEALLTALQYNAHLLVVVNEVAELSKSPAGAVVKPLGDGRQLWVTANAETELREIFATVRLVLLIFVLALLMTLMTVRYAVNSRLKPLADLCQGLDSLGDGDYRVSVAGNDIEEIDTLVQHYERLALSLEAKRQQVRELRQRVVELQEAERQQLARELHDNLGQLITGITVQAFMLKQKAEQPEIVQQAAEHILEYCERTHDGMRSLTRQLFPVSLAGAGLLDAIRQLANEWSKMSGISIQLVEEVEILPANPQRDTHLYRVVQEVLTNVAKHAEASQVEIAITQSGDQLDIRIADNGNGMASSSKENLGMGLQSIQERAELLNAELLFESNPVSGTKVQLSLPLHVVAST